MPSRFPVLAWHSINVLGNQYAANDLIAFASDLRALDRLGYRVWPLGRALEALRQDRLPEKIAVLTADDGSVLDFEDFDHPSCGPQKSMRRIMAEFAVSLPGGHGHELHVSSFVIASPEARAELDRTDYMGLEVWSDHWWPEAAAGGLVSVESHSWDHNHASLAHTCQRDNRKGDFRLIETEAECRAEIDRASDYIARKTGRRPRYLAYPYGQASDYLRREYLPTRGPNLGLDAALACDPEPVTQASDPWYLPRFMCGRDWNSPEDFERLLRSI